jgi:phage gpG-like protein
MIRQILDNLPETQASLQLQAQHVTEALRERMNLNLYRLQSHIQREHLSAPPGPSDALLHQRSGRLISSIRVEEARREGGALVGRVLGAGGPAWYGRVHEFGGTWVVPAREAVRTRLSRSGKVIGAKTFAMRSFTVTMPERSFMRASLAELQTAIIESMREAMSSSG